MSVVVPTYQRRAQLDAMLDELLERCAPAEIVVVDDGSTDGSAELLARRAEAEPRLRPLSVPNGGPMAARLAGAHHASGEVLLLLDDDVRPAPGLAEGHARRHAAAPGLVVVGAMPVAPGPVDRRSFPRDLYAKAYMDQTERWARDPSSILKSFWTGHFSIARSALLAVEDRLRGGPRDFHEDLDLGLCLAEAGMRATYDPALRGVHDYRRAPDRYMVDGFRSGQGLAQTKRRHGDALAALGDPMEGGRMAAARRWLGGPSPLAAAGRRLGAVAVTGLGLARLLSLQRFVASRLWRVEQERGFRAEAEGRS